MDTSDTIAGFALLFSIASAIYTHLTRRKLDKQQETLNEQQQTLNEQKRDLNEQKKQINTITLEDREAKALAAKKANPVARVDRDEKKGHHHIVIRNEGQNVAKNLTFELLADPREVKVHRLFEDSYRHKSLEPDTELRAFEYLVPHCFVVEIRLQWDDDSGEGNTKEVTVSLR